jgi:hypothetical protein
LSIARTREYSRHGNGDRPSESAGGNGAFSLELDPGDEPVAAPPSRLLFIVADNQLGLYRHLAKGFEGNHDVEVILDRRRGDRRTKSTPPAVEHRQRERRSPYCASRLQSYGWLMAWSQLITAADHNDDGAPRSAAPVEVIEAPALRRGREIAIGPVERDDTVAPPGDETVLAPRAPEATLAPREDAVALVPPDEETGRRARDARPALRQPLPEASDDWGSGTADERQQIESIKADLGRHYGTRTALDDPATEDIDYDRDDRARGRRPAVVALLAGGLLAVAALGYLAVTVVGHWTRSAPPVVSSPVRTSPSATREHAAVREPAPAREAATPPAAETPKRPDVTPAPRVAEAPKRPEATQASRAAEAPRRADVAPPVLPPRPTSLAGLPPARDERPGRATATAELATALRAWVDTINRRQLAAHVAWYADPVPVFYSGRNVPRSTVRNVRARTFSDATRIDVRTNEPDIRVDADSRTATMVFRESYVFEGPRINRHGNVVQELKWRRGDDGWRIIVERTREDDKGQAKGKTPRG